MKTSPFLFFVVPFVALTAFIFGVVATPILTRYWGSNARKHLPSLPVVNELTLGPIETTGVTGVGHVAAQHFRFKSNHPADLTRMDEIARLFEPQLMSAGWEKLDTSTGSSVYVS